jgi:acetolactate synthase-1/2/3 large subunit
MLGMHGSAFANYAVQHSDCLIAVGARFDDRVTGNLATFAPHAKIIHIDIDPSSISKNVDVDIPVVGDARLSLEAMLPLMEHRDRREWFEMIDGWKKKFPFRYKDDSQKSKPQYVLEEINKQTGGDAIITTGVGQHQMWAAQFYRWRQPRPDDHVWRTGDDGLRPAQRNRRAARPTWQDRHRCGWRCFISHDLL